MLVFSRRLTLLTVLVVLLGLVITKRGGQGTRSKLRKQQLDELHSLRFADWSVSAHDHNAESIIRLEQCLVSAGCPERPVILSNYIYLGLQFDEEAPTQGEVLWMRSVVRAVEEEGYIVIHVDEYVDWVALSKEISSLVHMYWTGEKETLWCTLDPLCIATSNLPGNGAIDMARLFTTTWWGCIPSSWGGGAEAFFGKWEDEDWSWNPLGPAWCLTPYDYPGNTFLPWTIGENASVKSTRTNTALVFGKNAQQFMNSSIPPGFWSGKALESSLEFLSTVEPDPTLPPGLYTIGRQSQEAYDELLSTARVVVGMGRPVISPTVYFALSRGTPVVLPIFDETISGDARRFGLKYSQHSMAISLGEPYVFTFRAGDEDDLLRAVEAASRVDIAPFVPPEFTPSFVQTAMQKALQRDYTRLVRKHAIQPDHVRQRLIARGEMYTLGQESPEESFEDWNSIFDMLEQAISNRPLLLYTNDTYMFQVARHIITLTNSTSPVRFLSGTRPELVPQIEETSLRDVLLLVVESRLREIMKHLTERSETACMVSSRLYTRKNLIDMNGCQVNIVANVSGFARYLFFDGWVDVDPWRWKDTDRPTMLTLRITDELVMNATALSHGEIKRVSFDDEEEMRLGMNDDGMIAIGLKTKWLKPSEEYSTYQSHPSYSFRLNTICCPRPGPWLFYRDEALASNINDLKREKGNLFDVSKKKTLCDRLQAAIDQIQRKIDSLSTPMPLRPLPGGTSAEWISRNLPACANLCNPNICVETGSCMCVESNCPTAIARASSWKDLLRPHAKRYFAMDPTYPPMRLATLPEVYQQDRDNNPTRYNRLDSSHMGCFSADALFERAVKMLQKGEGARVFLPYYQGTLWFPPLAEFHSYALQTHDAHSLVIPFTHDWGVCDKFLIDLFEMRKTDATPHPAVRDAIAWAGMGDLNSDCYRPEQDVVIPPRTCVQDELWKRFPDPTYIKPVQDRRYLAWFKGNLNIGQGTNLRRKIVCKREGYDIPWNAFAEGYDYLSTLNDTVFCPLPSGTTGWTARTIDAIWAGCIPVIFSGTHHPFWDVLDWSQFSVEMDEEDLDQMEVILSRYSTEHLASLQHNVVQIRRAFLHPSETDIDKVLDFGPFFLAMHSTAMLNMRYPVEDDIIELT